MKQEMVGWRWHQPDHTLIICTLQEITTPTPALPDAKPTVSKHRDTVKKTGALWLGVSQKNTAASVEMFCYDLLGWPLRGFCRQLIEYCYLRFTRAFDSRHMGSSAAWSPLMNGESMRPGFEFP